LWDAFRVGEGCHAGGTVGENLPINYVLYITAGAG